VITTMTAVFSFGLFGFPFHSPPSSVVCLLCCFAVLQFRVKLIIFRAS